MVDSRAFSPTFAELGSSARLTPSRISHASHVTWAVVHPRIFYERPKVFYGPWGPVTRGQAPHVPAAPSKSRRTPEVRHTPEVRRTPKNSTLEHWSL